MKEEDHVVYLLVSQPESFNMLITALEANMEVPKMDDVIEIHFFWAIGVG